MVQESDEEVLTCACNKFVSDGILYRHMLKVMLNDDVGYIPD